MQIEISSLNYQLYKLIEGLESKQSSQIIVTRYGAPIAIITPVNKSKREKLFGCGKDILKHHDLDLDEFNSLNEDIIKEFEGDN